MDRNKHTGHKISMLLTDLRQPTAHGLNPAAKHQLMKMMMKMMTLAAQAMPGESAQGSCKQTLVTHDMLDASTVACRLAHKQQWIG